MALIRTVPAAMQAALESDCFFPVIMVWLDWPDAPVFAHSGVGVIDYDGEEWLGVGAFGSIQLPEESAGLGATAATLQLLGVPDEVFDRLEDPIRNRRGRVLFGCTTEAAGNVLVSDPIEVFSGYMDASRYVARKSEAEIRHGIELRLATGPSARARASVYHSHEDQSAAHPGDTFGALWVNAEAVANGITWPES